MRDVEISVNRYYQSYLGHYFSNISSSVLYAYQSANIGRNLLDEITMRLPKY